MKNLFFAIVAVSAMLFTSCNGNDEITSTSTFNAKMVNTVISSKGSLANYQGEYIYSIDYVASTVTITAMDVQFSPMMPKVTFILKDVPFNMSSEKGCVINTTNIVPYVNGTQSSDYTISKISGIIYPETVDSDGFLYRQVPTLSYTVNGTTINASTNDMYFVYNNSTLIEGGSEPFTSTATKYNISLNVENSNCEITIKNAQFAKNMPKLNMKFNDIAFAPTATGFTLDCSELTPVIVEGGNETPYPNYQITNVTGKIENNRLELKFTCTITDEKSSAIGTYAVTATGTLFKTM